MLAGRCCEVLRVFSGFAKVRKRWWFPGSTPKAHRCQDSCKDHCHIPWCGRAPNCNAASPLNSRFGKRAINTVTSPPSTKPTASNSPGLGASPAGFEDLRALDFLGRTSKNPTPRRTRLSRPRTRAGRSTPRRPGGRTPQSHYRLSAAHKNTLHTRIRVPHRLPPHAASARALARVEP